MKYLHMIVIAAILTVMTACATPQEKAAKSEAAVNEKKLELAEQYQDCMKKVSKGEASEDDCETIRKTLDALN